MKKVVVSVLALMFSFSVLAQEVEVVGLVSSVEGVINYRSHSNKLEFSVGESEYQIETFETVKSSEDNYSVKSFGRFALTLVKNTTGYHGSFVDKLNQEAYLISSGKHGKIVFKSYPIQDILPTCNFDAQLKRQNEVQQRGYIGNYNTTSDVYKLESRPEAPFCILVDFDGNNGKPYGGFGNNSYTVPGVSDAYAKIVWEQISDDFTPFDVNVTTSEEVFYSYPGGNRVICAFAEFGKPGWAGIAYVGSFGSGSAALVDIPVNPSPNRAADDARTGSHELGHTLGLSHDGGGGDPYYSGHGEYVPIMGSGDRPVSHWSTCEYSSGNNHEDDIAIMANTLTFIDDDVVDERSLIYASNGSVSVEKNHGIISKRSDKDLFSFEMDGPGSVNLTVAPGINKSNLDVRVRLLNSNKSELASNNPVGSRSASISYSVPSAGKYYIEVDGDGELTVNTGWSDYSSMGFYEISGSISGAKAIKYDAEVLSVDGFGSVCKESIFPEVTVKNNGSESINSFDVDLFIDGSFFRTESVPATLGSGQSSIYQLSELKETGYHDIEVVVKIANQTDQIAFNNEVETSYSLTQGLYVRFETDYEHFNGSNPFTWDISKSGNTVIESENVEVIEGATMTQDYCLTGGCYDFDMSGDYDPCFNYSQYKSGTYTGGEVVAYNGSLYEAKWWTTEAPTGSSWKNLGACPSVNATFTLSDLSKNYEYFSEASSALNGSYSNTFCVDLPTGVEEGILTETALTVYPNPTNGMLNVSMSGAKVELNLLNNLGQIVWQSSNAVEVAQVNVSGLPNGVYFVQAKSNNQVVSKKVIVSK